LPTVSLVHIVTQWSGSGGTEAYLSGQLASLTYPSKTEFLLIGLTQQLRKISNPSLKLKPRISALQAIISFGFDTVGWVIWPVKIVPEMTYKVSSWTLNLCSLIQVCCCVTWSNFVVGLLYNIIEIHVASVLHNVGMFLFSW